MLRYWDRLLVCIAFSGLACAPQDERVDRRADQAAALDQQIGGDIRPIDADVEEAPQRAVIIEGEEIPALTALQEVDISQLPDGFLGTIKAIHKISATKTLLYGSDERSWLFDESADNPQLVLIRSEVIAPPSSQIYVMENRNFWLLGEGSLAFPVPSANPELGQLALINVTPELMREPQVDFRVLYVGPSAMVLGHEGRVNIIKREGESARFVNLDLPKRGDQYSQVLAAGIGDGVDHYWFLTATSLKVLSRGENGNWRWVVSPFQAPVPPAADLRAAIFTTGAVEGVPRFQGRTIFQYEQRLYEQAGLQLVIESDEEEEDED